MRFEQAVQKGAATWGYRRMGEAFVYSISNIERGYKHDIRIRWV
jgi:hypothetical protein